jgi:hypothetical protein
MTPLRQESGNCDRSENLNAPVGYGAAIGSVGWPPA